jgi:RNA polymerase sigma factor (sigma-70 family)
MLDDNELVSGVVSGDLRAFNLLVEQYQRLVFHVVGKMIDNQQDVEDVCQEVFIKIYRGLHLFGFRSKLSTWIASIAYLSSVNHLKKAKKHALSFEQPDLEKLTLADGNLVEELTQKNLTTNIHKMVNRLPALYKVLVNLYHFYGFSYLEMVKITGIPEGTIKSHLFRARKMLKDQIIAK